MNFRLIPLILSLCFPAFCDAQMKTELNLHIGGAIDFANLEPAQSSLKSRNTFRGIAFGGVARQQISEQGFVALQVDAYQNWISLKLPENGLQPAASGFDFLGIGLGYEHRISLLDDRLSIGPNLGGQISYVNRNGIQLGFQRAGANGDWEVALEIPLREDIWVPHLYGGINASWRVGKNIALELQTLYRQGFRKLWDDMVEFEEVGGGRERYSFSTRGSQLAIYLGLVYAFTFNPN